MVITSSHMFSLSHLEVYNFNIHLLSTLLDLWSRLGRVLGFKSDLEIRCFRAVCVIPYPLREEETYQSISQMLVLSLRTDLLPASLGLALECPWIIMPFVNDQPYTRVWRRERTLCPFICFSEPFCSFPLIPVSRESFYIL